ncbi:MAG: hypothetical protein RR144_04650 [Clostridia bacterium]
MFENSAFPVKEDKNPTKTGIHVAFGNGVWVTGSRNNIGILVCDSIDCSTWRFTNVIKGSWIVDFNKTTKKFIAKNIISKFILQSKDGINFN